MQVLLFSSIQGIWGESKSNKMIFLHKEKDCSHLPCGCSEILSKCFTVARGCKH